MTRPSKTTSELPAAIQEVERRFAGWRKRKTGRARIPDALWDLAAGLVPAFGVTKVSKALGLNYTQLRDHVALRSGSVTASPSGDLTRIDFVQIQIAESGQEPESEPSVVDGGLIVEVNRDDGSTMTIRSSIDSVDVSSLVAAFVGAPCCR